MSAFRGFILLALSPCLIAAGAAAAAQAPTATGKADPSRLAMYDARVAPTPEAQLTLQRYRTAVRALNPSLVQEVNQTAAAIRNALERHPQLHPRLAPATGAPAALRARGGTLTPPAPGKSSEEIVRAYLRDVAGTGAAFGLSAADVADLVVLGDSAGGEDGLRMLRMEQRIADRPVFQSETRFLLDRQGRLHKVAGQLVPHARRYAPTGDAGWGLSAAQATERLLTTVGVSAPAADFRIAGDDGDGRIELTGGATPVAGPVTARQVLFPVEPGLLLPAWSLVVFTSGEQDWYAVVDASTGALLWRKNIRNYASSHDARFRVYVQADGVTPADNPAPASPTTATPGSGTQFPEIAPTIVSMQTAQDPVASPNGWIDDCPGGGCTADQTQTLGNNVLACLDRTAGADANICDTDANSMLDGDGRPTGNPDDAGRERDFLGTAPRDFETNYLPPPQGGAAGAESGQTASGTGAALDEFRRGAVTHLFYVSNWYHDQLFQLGFDEPSGNFQLTNLQGLGGAAGDRVLADAQDGAGTNNANFSTPPDGTSGRMQMFRFTGPTVDRDGGLDAEVVIHELTHGTSNRLVGNAAGLNWDAARGLGEGWSDFYALSLLNATNADDPDASYSSGGYATYKLIGGYLDNYVYGIRRFPFSTDNSVNPMTWADVDDTTLDLSGGIATSPINFSGAGGMEVHNSGELWTLSLWEVRSRVIADPAGAAGDVPTGNQTMLQLVTDGLKMTPLDPTFNDGRDALLDADCATNGCANEQWIWEGFADRGLGYGAAMPYGYTFGYTSSHVGLTESFSLPYLAVVDAGTDVAVDDSLGNNNGFVDPGEPVSLTVTLTNPWRAASKGVAAATATLTSPTAGVTILDGSASYGAIGPEASAAGEAFVIYVDPAAACGGSLQFTVTTTSELGTTATTFQLRVGMPNGTDPVVTYTATPNLAIPDGLPRASFTTFNIPDDLEIADLDFRVDQLTHTWTGDLTVMLRSPGGLGVDLISLIGGLVDNGSGDNLTDMLIDDDQVPGFGNDMVLALDSAAPFTGTWVPVFNGVWGPLAGFPSSDLVGNLSRFDGLSTLGDWRIAVSDQFSFDSGTLSSASLLVTPVAFECVAFEGFAEIDAIKTVTGDFSPGGSITYTLTLTNGGSAPQGDHLGDELTDTLPAEVQLVSGSASSGSLVVTPGTNTVTWNGAIAPAGGSVTITIGATIDPGVADGTAVSNQGTVSYDGDADDVNESTVLTDDPGAPGAADPTVFVVGAPNVTATKTVSGDTAPGGTVTYTVMLSNSGSVAAPDASGDELVDVLPAELDLVSASADSGTAIAMVGSNTVTWNGVVPAGGSVVITIVATVDAAPGTVVSNQATVYVDTDGDDSYEVSVMSDDPGTGASPDATSFTVAAASIEDIPTASETGLILLALLLMAAAGWTLRRRPAGLA